MENPKRIVSNLNREASLGNFQKIKNLFDKNNFNQKEIDEAFRICIHHYNKNQKDAYVNCIKLFLKKTPEINYRNPRFNNSTILMYSIDEGKDAPTDLIISCSKDDLDMNLPDTNGENTIFHLVNSQAFSQKTKIEFIKDLCLNDYNIYLKNNRKKTIQDILESKGNLNLLEEIKNKIKENKFDQNKLTNLYNEDKYEELFELIEVYEKNENNIEIINRNSFKYNKLYIELKAILRSLDKINKNKIDIKNHPYQMILGDRGISDLSMKIMGILQKVNFDGGGSPNDNNNNFVFSLCLIINKMIMFYQLDYYFDLVYLTNNITKFKDSFSIVSVYFHLYEYFIKIDMMIQRGLYSSANDEFNEIKELIEYIEVKRNSNRYYKKKSEAIIPKDIVFDYKNIQNLFKLYQIYIASLLERKKEEEYNSQINELKNIQIEESDKENNQVIEQSNNNYKSFQKYLFLRLNYLKNSKNKISYIMTDPLGILNIEGVNTQNELNKIYFYHYQGIISLKNENYYISTYFFLKCFYLISIKSSNQLIKRNHFYPTILYNLSLSYFYSKKYKETIKCLYMLLNYSNNKSKFFINNKYIYYRLGLSNLEILMEENRSINLLYDSFINKKFILKIPKLSSFYEKLDIIEYFKKAFNLIKNDPKHPIYFSTLINLVFCNIIKQNYMEAIFYLKLNKSTDINNINIIRTYLFQCYIYINKIDFAEKISREMLYDNRWLKSNKKDMLFFEKLNARLVKIKGFKISVLVDMIKLCIEKKKIKEMQKYLMAILDSINLDISFCEQGKINVNEEIPTYIINVFVYYYIMINRKDLALDIMKKRKIKEIIISNAN